MLVAHLCMASASCQFVPVKQSILVVGEGNIGPEEDRIGLEEGRIDPGEGRSSCDSVSRRPRRCDGLLVTYACWGC